MDKTVLFYEGHRIAMDDTNIANVTFNLTHRAYPRVVCTVEETAGTSTGDVNTYVRELTGSTAVIRTSVNFTGYVHVHVMS